MSEELVVMRRRDAIALGLKRYYTGKPCPRGHVCERFLPCGGCVQCSPILVREYVSRHPEKVKASQRKWKAANPEKVRAKMKRRYLRDPAIFKKHARLRRLAKPEAVKADIQRWREANPEKLRIYDRTRRALVAGVGGKHSSEQIVSLLERQKWKCAYCKASLRKKYHADHIMPIRLGGTNDISNIQCLCPTCNQRKHAKNPIAFANEIGLLL